MVIDHDGVGKVDIRGVSTTVSPPSNSTVVVVW